MLAHDTTDQHENQIDLVQSIDEDRLAIFERPAGIELAQRIGRGLIIGSSPDTGEGCADFGEAIGIIAEAVGYPLDDFDIVVDALDATSAERIAAVGEDPGQTGSKLLGEVLQRRNAAALGFAVPTLPSLRCQGRSPLGPKCFCALEMDLGDHTLCAEN